MFTPQRMLIARKRLKLTAKTFAEEIGVSTAQLSKIETGKSPISDEVLAKSAQRLGVSIAFLCT
jgi:transcriptional regulator with XRE-family HTH domain